MAYKEVEWLFQREVDETYNITVGDEVIMTTDEHPFWIVGKGWVESKNLAVGDFLTTSDGKELAIEKIEVKKEHKTVYNFKVKDFHTYFISNLGIWTHNKCGPQFSNKLTPDQWDRQYTDRGWTLDSIQNTIGNFYTTRKGTNRATGNSTTVYYNKDGSHVIVDDGTDKIIQISDKNNPNWKPDQSIQDPYIPD